MLKLIMDSDTKFDKAGELRERENYIEAIDLYKSLYEEEYYPTTCLWFIAVCYLLSAEINEIPKHWENFVKYAKKYIEELPYDPDLDKLGDNPTWLIYHNLGIAYQNIFEDKKQALEYYRKAISVKSDSTSIAYAGQMCMDLGDERQAISLWKTAAKMGNGDAILALNSRGIDVELN